MSDNRITIPQIKGLRRRWFISTLAVIALIVVLTVTLFAVTTITNNVATVREGLVIKATTTADFFASYVTRTYSEYYDSAYLYIESFDDAAKLDLQFIDTTGRILLSSYSMTAGQTPGTSDIGDALNSGRVSSWVGVNEGTGERIMAVSAPLRYSDGAVIGVMRYVTSLRLVDRQNVVGILTAVGIGLAVILLVIFINLVFLSSVVEPMQEITAVAQRISEGSYGTQITKKYEDEIGELADVLNDMSLKLSRAERAQTEFISSISHELRTPLTAITGWGETLAFDEGLSEDQKRGVGIIIAESRRLTKMVEELLEFTRMQDGRFTLSCEPMDVGAELEDSIFAYKEILKDDGMELEYDPSDNELPMINGDAGRLRQVFFNIFDNAAKYAAEGKKLYVGTRTLDGEVIISIRDFGPGIPEDELDKVKMKFYKGSSKKRGSGIGLAVCDEIIRYHGGSLTLSNAEGGGTLVQIKLPGMAE